MKTIDYIYHIFLIIIVLLATTTIVKANQLDCMAKNIYFESRGEPEAGQFMVGFVTMNRVRDSRWPNTICKVVYEPGQFSWTEDKHPNTPKQGEQWNKAVYIASIVMQSKNIKHYGYFFKRHDVKSKFFKKRTLIARVGDHEFYE